MEVESVVLIACSFSGVCVCATQEGCLDSIDHIINSWPGKNSSSSKAPTRLALLQASQGANESHRWGFQISGEEESFRWFKLGLAHEDELPSDIRKATELEDARSLRNEHDRRVIDLVSTFLGNLWTHTVGQITSRHNLSEEQVLQAEIHAVLGVPAIGELQRWGP